MKTSFDPYLPASSLPQTSPPSRTNDFLHESYQARSEEVSISLTTREGDQISIRQSAMSERINAQKKKDASLQTLDTRLASAGMSLSIQGDLSDQEISDLSALLGDLSVIADDFFNGNLTKAMTGAMNINDMGTISKLEATFSRTSVLANYLEVPHPLPSFNDQQHDPLLNEVMGRAADSKTPSMLDSLTAQWQQFLDALTEQDTLPARQQPPPSDISAAMTGRQMFERSQQTMSSHPRLTPLLPSIAELALDQVMRQFDQGREASQLAKDVSRHFNKEFNDWLL